MTLSEFNAWLDGFMHGKDAPSAEEWKLISEKLASVRVVKETVPVPVPSVSPSYPAWPPSRDRWITPLEITGDDLTMRHTC